MPEQALCESRRSEFVSAATLSEYLQKRRSFRLTILINHAVKLAHACFTHPS
jgi:hypothetical protein